MQHIFLFLLLFFLFTGSTWVESVQIEDSNSPYDFDYGNIQRVLSILFGIILTRFVSIIVNAVNEPKRFKYSFCYKLVLFFTLQTVIFAWCSSSKIYGAFDSKPIPSILMFLAHMLVVLMLEIILPPQKLLDSSELIDLAKVYSSQVNKVLVFMIIQGVIYFLNMNFLVPEFWERVQPDEVRRKILVIFYPVMTIIIPSLLIIDKNHIRHNIFWIVWNFYFLYAYFI